MEKKTNKQTEKTVFKPLCNGTVEGVPLKWFFDNALLDSNNLRIDCLSNAANLRHSIVSKGILKPIEISVIGGKFVVCRGNCRTQAVKNIIKEGDAIKWDNVPCIFKVRTQEEHLQDAMLDFEGAGLSFQEQAREILREYNALKSEITSDKLLADEKVFRRWFSACDATTQRKSEILKSFKQRQTAMKGFIADVCTLDYLQGTSWYVDFMSTKPTVSRSNLRLFATKKAEILAIRKTAENEAKAQGANVDLVNQAMFENLNNYLAGLLKEHTDKIKAEAERKKAEKAALENGETPVQTVKDGDKVISLSPLEISLLVLIRENNADLSAIGKAVVEGKFTL